MFQRHMRVGDGNGEPVVNRQQPVERAAGKHAAESRVEIGIGGDRGPSRAARIVGPAVVGNNIDAINIDPAEKFIERRCGAQLVEKILDMSVVIRELARTVAIADDNEIPAGIVGPMIDNLVALTTYPSLALIFFLPRGRKKDQSLRCRRTRLRVWRLPWMV